MKLNYIKKMNGKIVWKQIEVREDSTVYMRLAQRPLIIIRKIPEKREI